jgi:hypothetical protein
MRIEITADCDAVGAEVVVVNSRPPETALLGFYFWEPRTHSARMKEDE